MGMFHHFNGKPESMWQQVDRLIERFEKAIKENKSLEDLDRDAAKLNEKVKIPDRILSATTPEAEAKHAQVAEADPQKPAPKPNTPRASKS
jgi:hypothetical protein